MTTSKKTRELPQSGGSFKRHTGGLKQVEGGTKDALPFHLRDAAATAPKATKTPAAKAPKAKPAKAAKSKGKSGGAATAAVAQNTSGGADNAGGSSN